jgi:uncharacterized membrane protein YhaH (DUF805 family)
VRRFHDLEKKGTNVLFILLGGIGTMGIVFGIMFLLPRLMF